MEIHQTTVRSVLTRSSGFLRSVSSHSLQPYRGCSFGSSLCGVGCYVRHNTFLTRGSPWGGFLEARTNASQAYAAGYDRERRWARRHRQRFTVFMSSSTDPFVPQETRFQVTRRVLEAMTVRPPDVLILQTHTHLVTGYLELYSDLARLCELRFHLSIESDRERLPGLPPPASPLEKRFLAAATLRRAGLRVVITVAPLLPIRDPEQFFRRVESVADAVVLDHFVAGDGTVDGSRTLKTPLPAAMAGIDPSSLDLSYRDRMVAVARSIMPGRVGVHVDGFAGRFLPAG